MSLQIRPLFADCDFHLSLSLSPFCFEFLEVGNEDSINLIYCLDFLNTCLDDEKTLANNRNLKLGVVRGKIIKKLLHHNKLKIFLLLYCENEVWKNIHLTEPLKTMFIVAFRVIAEKCSKLKLIVTVCSFVLFVSCDLRVLRGCWTAYNIAFVL